MPVDLGREQRAVGARLLGQRPDVVRQARSCADGLLLSSREGNRQVADPVHGQDRRRDDRLALIPHVIEGVASERAVREAVEKQVDVPVAAQALFGGEIQAPERTVLVTHEHAVGHATHVGRVRYRLPRYR